MKTASDVFTGTGFHLHRRWLLILVIAFTGFWFQGCGSSSPATSLSQQEINNRLNQSHNQWRGTPYRLGGTTRSGVDCSAFVMIVMRDQFGVELPRTTQQQMNFGSSASPRSLRVGDLVFFQTGRRTYHVGIVMQNGQFLHASTSRGVMISGLREPYWQERFLRARRVL